MVAAQTCYFFGLNAIRMLSVVGLLLVFSSSIFVMVNDIRAVNHFSSVQGTEEGNLLAECDYIENSTVPNQAAGAFWAVLNRLLIIFQVIILLLSELSWPAMGRFFDTYFPVLGPSFGLGALGVFECLIGAAILSHHVDDFALVAAFFLFSIGCVNILLGLVFRTRAKELRSIPAFREAGKPVLPTSTGGSVPPFASARSASPVMDEKVQDWDAEKSYYRGAPPRDQWQGYGFGRQGEKAAGLRGFLISKPIESLPRYAPGPRPDSVASSARSSPTRGRSPARSSIRQESRERPVPTFASSGSAI